MTTSPVKKRFSTELCYVFGLIILALGTVAMEKADFGMSMIVAPAYIAHLALKGVWPFFTFGMAEYTLQALLLIVLCLVTRRARPVYLFSFVTAVIYGFILDGCLALAALLPALTIAWRVAFYVVGLVLCAIGVSLLFHTYFAPEAYELFVKVLSSRFHLNIHRCKTCYDIVSMLVGVAISFCCFGFGVFKGVNWGTLVCALVNGFMISRVTRFLEARFEFVDSLPLRRYFDFNSN